MFLRKKSLKKKNIKLIDFRIFLLLLLPAFYDILLKILKNSLLSY